MGLLHRAYARSTTDVWNTEGRLLHSLGLVRRPVAAQWLVTAACDMKCPHCYSAAGKRVAGELSTQEARRLIIDPLVELGCPLLVLAGGELLLRPDVPELVEYARSRGLDWAMHTHGMHVRRHRALFDRHPPVLAAISLDGDRSFHDAFRGREGSFDAALDAAAILSEAGCPEVVLGTTVTRDNADHIADLFPLVNESRANSWGLHLFAPEGRGHDHAELLPTPGQLRRVAAFARRRRGRMPIELCNEWGSAGKEDLYYRDQPFTCGAGSISLVISATGDVLPCTTTDPSEREGNVRQTPLTSLWTQRFDRFRSQAALVSGECWLQSRNGQRCAEHAFGPLAQVRPLWIDRLPRLSMPRRGHTRARLVGPRASAAIGMVATGLVVLQACAKPMVPEPHAAGAGGSGVSPKQGTEPASTSTGSTTAPWSEGNLGVVEGFPAVLQEGLRPHLKAQRTRSAWARLRKSLAECEAAPQACENARRRVNRAFAAPDRAGVMRHHIDTLSESRSVTFAEGIALLDIVEQVPTYDAWLAGHVWRATRDSPVRDRSESAARVLLYARLIQHHRVIDAIKTAETSSGPVEIRPWLKKSGPPPDFDPLKVPAGLARAAWLAYPDATATTWRTMALPVGIESNGLMLARAGWVSTLPAGTTLSLGRLDVLWCPEATTLQAPGDRALSIPAGTEVTLMSLADRLGPRDRAALSERVSAVIAGDPSGLDELEADLVLAHPIIRAQLSAKPQAPGAAGLRQLLVLLDE